MKYFSFVIVLLALLSCQQQAKTNQKEMQTIKYIERASGETKTENVPSEGMLKWLYSSATGKVALNILFKRKTISSIAGWFMDCKFSAKRIPTFIEEHNINVSEFKVNDISQFETFNQFFYRKLKPETRPIGEHLVSPADGKILAFQSLNNVSSFFIKGSEFTIESFLQNKDLAAKYEGGAMAIVRLAPADYHRFHFPASGRISKSKPIKGNYFSVSPLALQSSLRIFCENKREYSILESIKYGNILICDIGATMVGSIFQTYKPNSTVNKGDEKGYFAFGGSTLVLLFEKGKITFDEDLVTNTKNGLETSIRMGENIAK